MKTDGRDALRRERCPESVLCLACIHPRHGIAVVCWEGRRWRVWRRSKGRVGLLVAGDGTAGFGSTLR